MTSINEETTAVLGSGSAEYALEEAALPIEELLAALEEMREEGVTHVVQASGNYRGAQWVRLHASWSWASEE